MRRLLRHISLPFQLAWPVLTAMLCIASAVVILTERSPVGATLLGDVQAKLILRLELLVVVGAGAFASISLILITVRRVRESLGTMRDTVTRVARGDLSPAGVDPGTSRELHELSESLKAMVQQLGAARAAQDEAQQALASRTRAVDRLLEFSQTIQGAGQSEQVYAALAQALTEELTLSGIVILTHHEGAVPAITVRAARPEGILKNDPPVAEMDPGMCPCLRQNMSKHFRPEASPIRCAVDQSITIPATNAAHCIPFRIGRHLAGVAHMTLPEGQEWSEDRCHLAATYVNAAMSSLISLHLVEEAERQSLTDSLTGLYNRHSMEKLLQREVALAERHGHAMSLVMIDMDHFKGINDLHGHAAGDHMLRALADCVRMTLRKTDLAFRYGGDEFVIALPQTPLAQAQQVVQKLRQAFASVDFSHAITRLDKQPTLSIGVAERCKANNLLTLESLLTAADEALYEAKSASRNCIRVYHPKAA